MKTNIFRRFFGKANSSTDNNAPRVELITADEALEQIQGTTPADKMSKEQQRATLDKQFTDRLEAARGKAAAEIVKQAKQARKRAGEYQIEAATTDNEKQAAAKQEAADRWLKLADQLEQLAKEAADKEAADKKAAEEAAEAERARLQQMTPEEVAADPKAAQKIADAKRAEAKTARKTAKKYTDTAKKKEEEAAAAELTAAEARKAAGEESKRDDVTITAARLQASGAAIADKVRKAVREMMKKAAPQLAAILDGEYNLSQVISRLKKAGAWEKVAAFLDACNIPLKREDFTPALFSADNCHPFLLVATGEGLKVGTMKGNRVQIVKYWRAELLIEYILTSNELKKLQASGDITPEQVAAHREALNTHEAALQALKAEREAAAAAKAEAEQKKAEADKAADVNETPEITLQELEQKQQAAAEAEAEKKQTKKNERAKKAEADKAGAKVSEEKKKTRKATRAAKTSAKQTAQAAQQAQQEKKQTTKKEATEAAAA